MLDNQVPQISNRIFIRFENEMQINQIEMMAEEAGVWHISTGEIQCLVPRDEDGKAMPGYELYDGPPKMEWGWFGGSAEMVSAFGQAAKTAGFWTYSQTVAEVIAARQSLERCGFTSQAGVQG